MCGSHTERCITISELDDLCAAIFGMEDELVCLYADRTTVESDEKLEKIEQEISDAHNRIAVSFETIQLLERENHN